MTFSGTYIFQGHVQEYLPQFQSSSSGSDGSGADSSSSSGSDSGSKAGTSSGSGRGSNGCLPQFQSSSSNSGSDGSGTDSSSSGGSGSGSGTDSSSSGSSGSGSGTDSSSSGDSGSGSKAGTSSVSGHGSGSESNSDGSNSCSSGGGIAALTAATFCEVDPRLIASVIKIRAANGALYTDLSRDDLLIIDILAEWRPPTCCYLDIVDIFRDMLADYVPITGSARFWKLFSAVVLAMERDLRRFHDLQGEAPDVAGLGIKKSPENGLSLGRHWSPISKPTAKFTRKEAYWLINNSQMIFDNGFSTFGPKGSHYDRGFGGGTDGNGTERVGGTGTIETTVEPALMAVGHAETPLDWVAPEELEDYRHHIIGLA